MGAKKTKKRKTKKTTPSKLRVGIDFGTTHTIVALADDGNYPILNLPFEYKEEVLTTDRVQSCVAFYDGHILFGPAAHACHLDHYEDGAVLIKSIKRLLRDWHEGQQINFGEFIIDVDELLTQFLTELRYSIFRALDIDGEPEIEAVIAVPANAPSSQRFVTLRCFKNAGFKIVRILDEPCASAIQFVHERYKRWDRVQADVIIYDLGGGTFDTTYLAIRKGTYDPRLTRGISRLGGDDFDELLLQMVEEKSDTNFAGAERVRMLDIIREAKESIGPRSRNLHVETKDDVVTIKIKEFEERAAELVDRTIQLVDDVVHKATEGEKTADRIVLVGGGSLLRSVIKKLQERYGKTKLHRGLYPLASVAIGAAIQAGSPELAVRDRLTNHFGVVRVCEDGSEYIDVIFPKGQVLPQKGESIVVARPPYDPRYNIGCFRYLECDDIVAATGKPTSAPVYWNEVRFPYDCSLSPGELTELSVERCDHLRHELILEEYALDEFGIITSRISRTVQDEFSNCYNLFRRP